MKVRLVDADGLATHAPRARYTHTDTPVRANERSAQLTVAQRGAASREESAMYAGGCRESVRTRRYRAPRELPQPRALAAARRGAAPNV